METREQIINKVKKWIVEVLEPMRPELSGFAACPFVKAERLNDKIMYGILDGNTKLVDLVKEFDRSSYTTAVFVQLLEEDMSPEDGLEYQRFINAVMKENGLGKYKNICFNPKETLSVNGFCPRSQAPYFMINIAPRKDLIKAHESLLKTKYFDNFPEKYRKYLQY